MQIPRMPPTHRDRPRLYHVDPRDDVPQGIHGRHHIGDHLREAAVISNRPLMEQRHSPALKFQQQRVHHPLFARRHPNAGETPLRPVVAGAHLFDLEIRARRQDGV